MESLQKKAIEKYLEKPKRQYSNGGCACMGPQMIKGFTLVENPYNIELKNNENRSKFIIKVHKRFDITMAQAKEMVDSKKVGFDNPYICKDFQDQLEKQGISTEVIKKPTGEYPECSCRMDNIVEVEGHFYKVKEEKSIMGIDYQAYLLGKIGGPYVNV